MSTFRPPQVPQQPQIFFTPGSAPVSPIAGGGWRQDAAYRRDPWRMPQLSMFATRVPAAAVPPVAFQMPTAAARSFDAALIEEQLPFFTAGTAAGVVRPMPLQVPAPPMRTLDIALIEEQTPFYPFPPISAAPALPMQMPVAAPRASDVALIEEQTPFFTPSTASAVPIAPSTDQSAAYRRDPWIMPQIVPFSTAPPANAFVPPMPMQLQATRSADIAMLQRQSRSVPAGATLVPPNPVQTPVNYRVDWAPWKSQPFAAPAPTVFVPAMPLQMLSNFYVAALQPRLGIAAILAPAPVAQPFVRGELIPLAPPDMRIAVTFDDRRIVFGADAGRLITVSADDRRVGVSANDRFIVPTPGKPH
jgi:hypothetical protein